MHNLWCGKKCCDCETSCEIDMSIPCSPDCEYLSGDGLGCGNEKPCDFFHIKKEVKENVI